MFVFLNGITDNNMFGFILSQALTLNFLDCLGDP